jgi:ketosteroid isomerase-like protein
VSQTDLLERLRAAYREWHDTRGASHESWLALMADDVRLHSIADGAPGAEFSARRAGRAAARAYFAGLLADWEMLHFTPETFHIDGVYAVVFSSAAWRNRATGRTVETPVIHRMRFENGLVADVFEFYDTAKVFAAVRPSGG